MMTDQDVSPVLERPVTVKAFGITDKGKVRPNNEDQFLIAELTKSMRVCQTSLTEPKLQVGEERAHLFLVADGMGGHRARERASALAVVAIERSGGSLAQIGPKCRKSSRSSSPRSARSPDPRSPRRSCSLGHPSRYTR